MRVALLCPVSSLITAFLVNDLLLKLFDFFLDDFLLPLFLLYSVFHTLNLFGTLQSILLALGSQDRHRSLCIPQQNALFSDYIEFFLHVIVIILEFVNHGFVSFELGLSLLSEQTLLILHVSVPTL